MADKIVQLIDKDGDNIYPISSVPHGASITMTTNDPGEGSALEDEHYIGVYGGTPIILDYSANEINTGAKWIDGKDIYKKTISCGALPNATTKNVAHGISDLHRVLKVEGYAISSGGTTLFLPVVATNDQYDVTVSTTATNIVMETQVNRSGYAESYLTLYYTKTQ